MILKFSLLICLSLLTVSCHFPFSGKRDQIELNEITENAHKFKAKYGTDYLIKGDQVAQYEDFDLSLYSVRNCPHTDADIYTYEITSKDGYQKRQISISSKETDKKHFYAEDAHFYYHSNGAYTINIYMPPQLLANNSANL